MGEEGFDEKGERQDIQSATVGLLFVGGKRTGCEKVSSSAREGLKKDVKDNSKGKGRGICPGKDGFHSDRHRADSQ